MKTTESEDYYTHPAEVWDAKKCAKMVKRTATDGLGTPYGFRGACPEVRSGRERYNGGTVIGDKWYQGVIFQLPVLAKGYKWAYVPTWCMRITLENEVDK